MRGDLVAEGVCQMKKTCVVSDLGTVDVGGAEVVVVDHGALVLLAMDRLEPSRKEDNLDVVLLCVVVHRISLWGSVPRVECSCYDWQCVGWNVTLVLGE